MNYEAKCIDGLWRIVDDTGKRIPGFFTYQKAAEIVAGHLNEAFHKGADHAQQVSHIQETLTPRCWCNAMLTATDKCTIHAEAQ